MHHLKIASAVLVALALPCAAQAAGSCSDLLKFKAAGTTIEKAEDVAAGPVAAPPGAPPIPLQAPAHCRVDGIIGAHRGPNGKPYGIRFALALPPNWNGRLLYQGGGGLNGSVQAPVGMTATGDGTALARGFAVVTSDLKSPSSGHRLRCRKTVSCRVTWRSGASNARLCWSHNLLSACAGIKGGADPVRVCPPAD